MLNSIAFRSGLVLTLLVSAGCSRKATGSEQGECYSNGTCNAGLSCLSNFCVKPGSDSGSLQDLSVVDAAKYDDAGLPCPGASIFHPGTETRMVGTSIPFVGR